MTPARGSESPTPQQIAERVKPASEKQEQAAIVDLLQRVKAVVYVIGTVRPAGDFRGTCQTPGIPDLYAFVPLYDAGFIGYSTLWIEVKAKGGKLRPQQESFRVNCEHADIDHLVGGVDVVVDFLKQRGLIK